jgi:hypothetical protein
MSKATYQAEINSNDNDNDLEITVQIDLDLFLEEKTNGIHVKLEKEFNDFLEKNNLDSDREGVLKFCSSFERTKYGVYGDEYPEIQIISEEEDKSIVLQRFAMLHAIIEDEPVVFVSPVSEYRSPNSFEIRSLKDCNEASMYEFREFELGCSSCKKFAISSADNLSYWTKGEDKWNEMGAPRELTDEQVDRLREIGKPLQLGRRIPLINEDRKIICPVCFEELEVTSC